MRQETASVWPRRNEFIVCAVALVMLMAADVLLSMGVLTRTSQTLSEGNLIALALGPVPLILGKLVAAFCISMYALWKRRIGVMRLATGCMLALAAWNVIMLVVFR